MKTETRNETAKQRLEYLRGELRAERISYGELAELQSLRKHIAPDDVELLEAAGVPEAGGIHGPTCPTCGRDNSEYGNVCTDDDCDGVQRVRDAAPELLEALQALTQAANAMPREYRHFIAGSIDLARAAIARAIGAGRHDEGEPKCVTNYRK